MCGKPFEFTHLLTKSGMDWEASQGRCGLGSRRRIVEADDLLRRADADGRSKEKCIEDAEKDNRHPDAQAKTEDRYSKECGPL
jgi:hypothetical protein